MEQWQDRQATYNLCQAIAIEDPVDAQVLETSLNAVIQRHEILRTSFAADNGQPYRIIAPEAYIPWRTLDLRQLPAKEREDAGWRAAEAQARQPFDLGQCPLLRALLIELAEKRHLLVLTIHQMVCDGWSLRILVDELWTWYDAMGRHRLPNLPTLTNQYSDFVIWQRQLLNQDWLQPQIAHWRQVLQGPLPLLALPADRPRPALESFRGARVTLNVDAKLTAALREISRQRQASLFMTLMAAFKVLLHRYSGEGDSLVGFPVANRHWGESSGTIGFFVNTLLARTTVAPQQSFNDFLAQVRAVCQSAYANQDLPFEKVVEMIAPARDLSRNPLFQALFTFHNMTVGKDGAAPPRWTPVSIDNGAAKVDLTLSLAEQDDRLAGFFEYSTDLFDDARMERLAGHFLTLLGGIVADADRAIANLPLLSEAERRQILLQWNDTAADYPQDRCVHQLFELQAEKTPDAIAVECADRWLSYGELNRRANQLAHHLIGLGIGPEKLVAIAVERSIDMVVGLLAILKAGGAYLPLDPNYPGERMRLMIEDSQAALLLSEKRLAAARQWEFKDGVNTVYLDDHWPIIARHGDDNPNVAVKPNQLAYVIYTSGSTGLPKGVAIEHRALVNCLVAIGKQIGIAADDGWLAVTTISFDIAALELYLPLIAGARTIIASQAELHDGAALLARLSSAEVTIMQATPSLWKLLLTSDGRRKPGLKILSGGEALARPLADRLLNHSDSVWNLYGPSETTIWSTLAKVAADGQPITIGRPIANTKIYILDSRLQPTPIGVPGDLYIGGDGLARGYWHRPELTAERFIPDPFNADGNGRLYRTGDRARYRADGEIEFLGRDDYQVKIRGHRIELGEIEAALQRHPAIKEAVIVARNRDSSDEPELIAHLVCRDAPEPAASALRQFLRRTLPDPMVPATFVFIERMPLTPNGKIDRKALPAPDGAAPRRETNFTAPRNEIETAIAQVWSEVLGRPGIGVDDNFFDLGGHSLIATRIAARLRAQFKIEIALRKLFELPTVAALATYVEQLRHGASPTALLPILPAPRSAPLPLAFSQWRLWYLQKADADLSAYNIPAAFRIRGPLQRAALEQALNDLVARHESLRSFIVEIAGEPRQEILPSLRIDLPVIDLTHLSVKQAVSEAKRLAAADAVRLFDLSVAPLLRATVVKLTDDDQLLIFNLHHIIADGASLGIFYRELAAFYDAAQGATAALSPLPIHYGDYAAWQQHWLNSPAGANQLDYWRRQLADFPEDSPLPSDFPRPTTPTYQGARMAQALTGELTGALKELSRRHNVTPFMTLLATFNLLLARLSGREDLVIGSTIAGRNHPETEGLIGLFINALPLRCDLAGDPSFTALLQRVREICLDAYTHQDLPFEKIVEALSPRRDSGRNPIFDILFNLADVSERALQLSGCAVEPWASHEPAAKFDLVVSAPEIDGVFELALVYNTALYRGQRIALLLEQWIALLGQIVAQKEVPVSRLSLLTESARQVLPNPAAPLDDRWQGAIHELLAQQALRTPNNVATVDAEQSWSYADLDLNANRLARHLIDRGIKPKEVVAIYAHRGAPLALALLATLKAGAAFLILDPADPPARNAEYLRLAQVRGFIELEAAGTPPEELARALAEQSLSCRWIMPRARTEIIAGLAKFSDSASDIAIGANDPAYIAFTSGSTGEPKGVICRHGPITHFLPWQKSHFGLRQSDRFAMLAGLAYSHLHRDLFTALFLGETLYIPDASEARAPEPLARWLDRHAITVLHLTPALGQLLRCNKQTRLPALRRIFFGGDVLSADDIADTRRLAPNAVIGSFYGATETQRAVGYYEIAIDCADPIIPLGRGIADVQLLVLTGQGQLAGIGELGEIYVRSPHLAAGYIGDEELTEQVFMVNPFTQEPRDRLYRSGELGRYRADGNVEWAGRRDRRINIRGFRVELAEIEIALKRHPTVNDAIVVTSHFESSDSDNPKSKIQNPKSKIGPAPNRLHRRRRTNPKPRRPAARLPGDALAAPYAAGPFGAVAGVAVDGQRQGRSARAAGPRSSSQHHSSSRAHRWHGTTAVRDLCRAPRSTGGGRRG